MAPHREAQVKILGTRITLSDFVIWAACTIGVCWLVVHMLGYWWLP